MFGAERIPSVAFHTNAFTWAGVNDLLEIADFALESGFSALEVGPGIPLDAKVFLKTQERLAITNAIFCRNFLADDPSIRRALRAELYKRMNFFASVGVKTFVLSTGLSSALSLPENGECAPWASLEAAVEFLSEALVLAEKLDMRLLLENCPMYRNIATSPLMWRELFRRLPDERLGLCYDPSHCVWQMIDVYSPISEFGLKIRHVHLKDTTLDRSMLRDVGILHNVGGERGHFPHQWWRHTVLGEGEIDWTRFGNALDAVGYTGSLSFEMEDYRYEGKAERIREGLRAQREYIKNLWSV
jgi:sugar phosphate isomerase/epimerase